MSSELRDRGERERARPLDGRTFPNQTEALRELEGKQSSSPGTWDLALANQQEFVALRAAMGAAEPGTVRLPGIPEPWSDQPECRTSWRYDFIDRAQRTLEDRFADQGLTNETLAMVNPVDGRNGRDTNCAECARATACLLEGQPYAARPMSPDAMSRFGERPEDMELWAGRRELEQNWAGRSQARLADLDTSVVDPDVGAAFGRLAAELAQAGSGSHAVVEVSWKPDSAGIVTVDGQPPGPDTVVGSRGGHWFNIANVGGAIVYLDAQDGPLIAAADSEAANYYRVNALNVSWIRTGRNTL